MKIRRKHVLIVAVVVILLIAGWLELNGHRSTSQPEAATLQPAAVVLVQRRPIASSVTLSGEFRPFQEVEVHAKVAGYVRRIYVDVGDHVKAGQTLAVLEVPELSAEVMARMRLFAGPKTRFGAPKATSPERNRCMRPLISITPV